MFKSNQIIKHKNAMDVCFLIHKARGPYKPQGSIKFKGEWVNMGFVKSYHIGQYETLEIPIDELTDWQVCLEPNAECLRNAKWA